MRHLAAQRLGEARCAFFSLHSSLKPKSARVNFLASAFLVLLICGSGFGQVSVPTSRADNSRSNANTNETLLTPSNVNKNSFGRLFSAPVDYVVMAQPLFMPAVNIPGQGTHNVVYVVTQADSVYAIDADNGAQLWTVNFTNPAQGITTAQVSNKTLPCGLTQGFDQEGIVGTPVIDPSTTPNPTMYLVAKTALNGTTVQHYLHALDITTGVDLTPPVLIQATSISKAGHKTVFNSLHQKNRPGLLLLNGTLYLGFGSNSCNDGNSGWVLAYNETTLQQTAVFNTSPDQGYASIWQAGSGLAADESGRIFVETAETGNDGFDIQNGGQSYCNSVVELTPGDVDGNNQFLVTDYFTPWNVAYLNEHDFDLSSSGALILPDQTGPYPHELIAGGKYGMIYVLNRDNLGMYSAGADSQILQEFTLVQQPQTPKDVLFGAPAYWNNTVYFAPGASPLLAFPVLSSGLLGSPLTTSATYGGSHSPSISANGGTNGIMWVISSGLNALDAVSLKLLYNTNQAANSRDKLPPIGHFITQTVANGKVYVATNNSVEAYGLFYSINVMGGAGQSAPAATALSTPLQVNLSNPYTGQANIGASVSFSDGCVKPGSATCGSFNPASAVTDSNGNASTIYTVPQKAGTYTLTATLVVNGTASGSTSTTAIATAGAGAKFVAYGGGGQTGADGFNLANAITAQVLDSFKNPVPGFSVNFTATKGAIPNPATAVTDSTGIARTYLQLPNTPSAITVTGVSANPQIALTPAKEIYAEHSVASVATKISITNGNSQSGIAGSQLAQALTVFVADQYGNPLAGNSVTFTDNGAGGSFSDGNIVVTGVNGIASTFYTLPKNVTAITIDATATGVSTPAAFNEASVAGPVANIAVAAGNNQTAPNGTQLPQILTVLVSDQYGNPVSGISITFSDGGSGGIFSGPNPGTTGTNGTSGQFYTLPAVGGETIVITATAAGVANSAIFTEKGQ